MKSMPKPALVYYEQVEITARHAQHKSGELIGYDADIQIKDSGKQPVVMKMKFIGSPPGVAPMPPKEHTIRAKSIMDLYFKLNRWLGKIGYTMINPK